MNILWFILIGVAAGALAGRLTKGSGFGILGDLVVGALGAVVGGVIFDLLELPVSGLIGALVTATVGAVVLLSAVYFATRGRS